jgi:hypothetical protein
MAHFLPRLSALIFEAGPYSVEIVLPIGQVREKFIANRIVGDRLVASSLRPNECLQQFSLWRSDEKLAYQ